MDRSKDTGQVPAYLCISLFERDSDFENFNKKIPIRIISEDISAINTSRHDMMDGATDSYTRFSWHNSKIYL